MPRDGTVHEWITSIEVVNIRIGVLKGIIHRLSTSRRRKSLILSELEGIINESKFRLIKSEYSYLQYHWCPMDLIVSLLLWISSVKYKILIEGIAMKIKINIGVMVQINSIVWPWSKNRSINLLFIILNIINLIISVIKSRIIIVKSWKKIIIS